MGGDGGAVSTVERDGTEGAGDAQRDVPERLERLHEVMAGYVERGVAPGIVTLVSRGGDEDVAVVGTTAVGGDEPMTEGHDLSHRLDEQTDHGGGGDDPGRGVQAAAG